MEIMQIGEIDLPKMEENSEEIMVLDIETTGFLESGGKIVEIGMVLLNYKKGTYKTLFDEIIRPDVAGNGPSVGFSGSAWIFQNSDLTVDMVLEAKSLKEYKEIIQKLLNKYPVTAFNKKFDLGFLKKYGFKVPKELSCIMLELTPYTKLPGSFKGYKWPKVEEAWQFYFPGWSYTEKHRAYDDAFHEAKILSEMIKKGHYIIPKKPIPMDIHEERFFVSLGMRTEAGHFFKAIGEAIAHAHPTNLKIIKNTWPKEWEQYLEVGKRLHRKENE